jgi:hypothetical protein
VKAMNEVRVMSRVKPQEKILSEQINQLFDECERLMTTITQSIVKNKEKLNHINF